MQTIQETRLTGRQSTRNNSNNRPLWPLTEAQWRARAAAAGYRLSTFIRLAGVSRSVFYREFAAAMGKSPQAWLDAERLRVAPVLLAACGSVKTVATGLGFASPHHFSKVYKRHYGHAPMSAL
jgi:AraC-like DNA-binding protein